MRFLKGKQVTEFNYVPRVRPEFVSWHNENVFKVGKFTHADAGQMHLYLNCAREHWMNEGENPPVGLILCAEKNAAVAHYALEGLPNKVMAAEYKMKLPDEKILAAELRRSQRLLENRILARAKKESR